MANLNFRTVTVSGADYIWNTATNWDTGQLPVDNDQVTLGTGSPNLSAYTSVDDIASLSLQTLNIDNGVTLDIASSASLEVQTLGSSGSIDVIGTFFVHNINSNSGTIDVKSGGFFEVGNLSGNAFVIENGGTMQLNPGGNINGTPTIYLQGGLLAFQNTTGGNITVDFSGGSAGHLSITTQQVTNNNSPTLANLGAGDSIEFGDATVTAVNYNSGSSTLTVTANGTDYNIHIASFDGTGDSFILSTDPTTGRSDAVVVCYLRGSRIRTPDGEAPVEALRAGDIVMTLDPANGMLRPAPVTWVGSRRINLSCHPVPHTVAPIRIKAEAVGAGVPSRDLLVSPDHGVLVDGALVCARQLVNGVSIEQDLRPAVIDYFHVELAAHAILLAEDMPAESYLDTGNRGFFDNGETAIVLHPDLTGDRDSLSRQAGSCVPFVWEEDGVRPIWQRLSDRAATLGQPVVLPGTTLQPALRALVDGNLVRPVCGVEDRFSFVLPAGTREVRLLSRAAPPTDTRPWLEDRRRLGIYVTRIILRGASDVREIPLDGPALGEGWWAAERDGASLSRWTNGDAVLRLPPGAGPCLLELHAAPAAYPLAA